MRYVSQVARNGLGAFALWLPSAVAGGAGPQPPISPHPITANELRTKISPGLGCTFNAGTNVLFVVTVGEALVKLNGILRHFKLTDDRSLSIINYGGSIGDQSLRIIVDRDERITRRGDELTSRVARLTLRRGADQRTVNGRWDCGA